MQSLPTTLASSMGQIAKDLVKRLSLAAVALLTSASTPEVARIKHITFLSGPTGEQDPTFQRYVQALGRLPLGVRQQIVVRAVAIAEANPRQAEIDIHRELAMPADIVVAVSGESASIASRTPGRGALIFASYPDPVRFDFIDSLPRPGRNSTGVSLDDQLHAKRLEILRDAYPWIRRVGVIGDQSWFDQFDKHAVLVAPAHTLGLKTRLFVANTESEVDQLFQSVGSRDVEAWYIAPTYVADIAMNKIITNLRRLRAPAIHTSQLEMDAGATLAYVQDASFVYDALAVLTAQVASGADAGTLPVQRPRRFALMARSPVKGDSLPSISPSVLRRADRLY